ncbi:hypothetical protein Cgig2_007292 [Carnegiea gigantea]|uniref:Cupin type-1 domain-containing protein n=1 Tax=Carnegiea gigantea TaxID=171969 RepID=A0A9Q1KZL1_9CARY|nr:hypothetical protein Cgig2_007292 [Carnegiea gigantea]
MWNKRGHFLFLIFQLVLNSVSSSAVISYDQRPSSFGTVGRLVKKEERIPVVSTEFGAISAVDIGDGTGRHNFHLQFITLEPNALFLPGSGNAGSGRLSCADADDDELKRVELQRGDVHRVRSGSLFYLHSSLESERPRLRIIAIFASDDELELIEPFVGPYSSINDLIRGFDKRVLQAAFQVPDEVIDELTSGIDAPAIVHAEMQEKKKKKFWEKHDLFIEAMLGIKRYKRETADNKEKHSKSKTFNFFKADPDFQNCNGWSTAVTKHNLDALHGSRIGVFMVNLTKGAMMGPHWNPKATEVSVVLEGEGMVRMVCPSTLAPKECNNSRFRVEEGDVFAVPRFHPMAQISFNNGTLVFIGFSTTTKKNHPQFLAGKASVLQTLDRLVLGASFNVSNTTIDQLLAAQEESVILDCTNCAEEEEILMEKDIEKERQEEERRREEVERRRQEEEERRRREEEEKRRRHKEEEERKKREEEEERRRQEEEQRRKEEEERQRQEEEEKRREEEEERRRREEEQRRQEEEERRQQKEEQRRHEEEEERRRQGEEQRRQEEEEEEEAERQREEEEQRRRQEAEEEQRRREEEEEEARRREEEQRRQEEEEQRQQEEEEERRRRGEERGRGEEEESEEEAARREEQERVERERRQEEAARRRREHDWDLVKMGRDKAQSTGGGKGGRRSMSTSITV